MAKKKVKKRATKKVARSKKSEDSKLFAFLATFLSIIGFIIALIAKRNDKYVMHYASQSLVIFIMAIIVGVIQTIFLFLPVIGWIINAALDILVFLVWLISWIYALSGEKKEIPIVSVFSSKLKL